GNVPPRANQGGAVSHRGNTEARPHRLSRLAARGREDDGLVPHRRVQAGLLRARDRQLHHPPLGPRGHHRRGDRHAARLRPEAEGTRGLIDRLTAALGRSRADDTEIRVERTWSTAVPFRRRRLESAPAREAQGGFVRVLTGAAGWGVASFTSLDRLDAMVARAHELSRAVRVDPPIRLADVAPHRAEALLD